MKAKIITLCLLSMVATCGFAQSAFYVDDAKGDDANPGTEAQPWKSLEGTMTQWQNVDCDIHVAEGEYSLGAKVVVGANVNLIGAGQDKTFLQQFSEEEYNDDTFGELPSLAEGLFFVGSSKTMSVEKLSVRNIRLYTDAVAEDGSAVKCWGGGFGVEQGSKLVMNNVDMYNCEIVDGGGAAIDCKGTLDLTNVSFNNCKSSVQGAAVTLAGDCKGTFKGCTFENNTGSSTFQVYTPMVSDGLCGDLNFDQCLFKGNSFEQVEYASVLKIENFDGLELNLNIKNSTFTENLGNKGGCLFLTSNTSGERILHMNLTNNTFFRNKLTVGPHSTIFHIGGEQGKSIKGDLTFVNNTLFDNACVDPTKQASTIWIQNAMPIKLTMINNLSIDPAPGCVGIVFAQPKVTMETEFKNNVYEKVGGGKNASVAKFKTDNIRAGQDAQTPDENHPDAVEQPFIPGNDYAKLDTVMTYPVQGVPYLKLNEGSIAIDAGYNDGGTLVPVLDIRGTEIINEKKDAGAYEFGGTEETGVTVNERENLKAFVDREAGVVEFSEMVAEAQVYDLSGRRVMAAANVNTLSVAGLSAGVYVLTLETLDGNVSVVKVMR